LPNSTGGISVANNLLANTALFNLNKNQATLGGLVKQLSSGLRVNTAADDPSGLGIAENLQAQVNGFDTAVRNVQDAGNAANVADGALSSVTNILQRIRSLAIEASSDITSANDKANLQAEVGQLLLEVNRISTNTNFNGINLLDGSHAGFQPTVNAAFTITSNADVGAGGALIQTVNISTSANTIVDGSLELQVAQLNATQQALIVNFFTSSPGVGVGNNGGSQISVVTLTSGTTANFTFDGITVQFAGAATVDVGITSFVKITQFITAASNPTSPAFNFQSGANEGATIQVGLLSTSTSSLRITNVNVATTGGFAFLGAEDTIGQIDQALNTINTQRAQLGAVITRLNIDADNDNTASVNLQASESAIRDLNVGQATADYNKAQILVQIGTTVLAQSNTNAQTVLGLFR
jgi:flagellin